MDLLPRLRSFLTTLAHRERFDAALDEEVRFHLAAQAEDLVRSGTPPGEAARRARIQFGNIEAMKEACRQARGLRLIDALRQNMANVGLALRMLGEIPVAANVAFRGRPSWLPPPVLCRPSFPRTVAPARRSADGAWSAAGSGYRSNFRSISPRRFRRRPARILRSAVRAASGRGRHSRRAG